ncbi:hypothetical protein ACO2JO_18835 [Leptospira interrogans]
MADFWIVGGLMAGAFVSPLYFLVMRIAARHFLCPDRRAAAGDFGPDLQQLDRGP